MIDGAGFHGEGYRLDYWRKRFGDVKEEPQYYHFGYAVGRSVKYAFIIGVTSYTGLSLRPL